MIHVIYLWDCVNEIWRGKTEAFYDAQTEIFKCTCGLCFCAVFLSNISNSPFSNDVSTLRIGLNEQGFVWKVCFRPTYPKIANLTFNFDLARNYHFWWTEATNHILTRKKHIMRTFHTSHKAFIYSKAGSLLSLNQEGEAKFHSGAIYRQKSY